MIVLHIHTNKEAIDSTVSHLMYVNLTLKIDHHLVEIKTNNFIFIYYYCCVFLEKAGSYHKAIILMTNTDICYGDLRSLASYSYNATCVFTTTQPEIMYLRNYTTTTTTTTTTTSRSPLCKYACSKCQNLNSYIYMITPINSEFIFS